VLDAGLGLERAHMGIFTELAIQLSKYQEDRLMDHLRLFAQPQNSKIHIPQVIRECRQSQHWKALCFLEQVYGEPDNAALTMMEHTEAWDHVTFKDLMSKCSNNENLYKGITFYVEQHPSKLTDLLGGFMTRLDNSRVVNLLVRLKQLPLIKPYLKLVQEQNNATVNEALNGLFIEEEDFDGLRASISHHVEFDQVGLARALENHHLLEFRRIAAELYTSTKHFDKSLDRYKADQLWRECMDVAASSGSQDLAEGLAKFFMDNQNFECFSATLYICYDLIRPDVAIELAWVKKQTDMVMPYLIQVIREFQTKLDGLHRAAEEAKAAKTKEDAAKPAEPAAPTLMLANQPFTAPPGFFPGGQPGPMMGPGGPMMMGPGGPMMMGPTGPIYGAPGFGQPGMGFNPNPF